MDRTDWYYRQLVTEGELDGAFDKVEAADRAQNADAAMVGVMSGLTVAQSVVPDLNVLVALGTAYSKSGARMRAAAQQTVDVSKDFNNVTTAVTTPGNSKWISVFIKPDRVLSDARLDGNNATVYFQRAESFGFKVVQSAEAPLPTKPALDADYVLLCDIVRLQGQTTVTNADISTARREDQIVTTGTLHALHKGTAVAAFQQVMDWLNDHLDGSADQHIASNVMYGGGPAWADGTTNPATSVEAAIDNIITKLTTTTGGASGARKVYAEAATQTVGASVVTITAGTVWAAIDKIAANLAQIREDWSKLDRDEVITGQKEFTDLVTSGLLLLFADQAVPDDTAPSMSVIRASSTYLHLASFKLATAQRVRMYLWSNGASPGKLVFTVNAEWSGGTTWARDVNAEAAIYSFGNASIIGQRFVAAAGSFTEADVAGRATFNIPLGTPGNPSTTTLGTNGYLVNPEAISVHFRTRYYEGGGARPSGAFIPFPKMFILAPTTLSLSGTETNVNGGTAGITLTGYTNGVYLEWTTASSGDTLIDVDISIAP